MTSAVVDKTSSASSRWVLIAAVIASSMAFIDSTALNVALPALQSDFQAGGTDLLWIVNAYLLMLASLILVGGSLGDHIGRKRVFMLGIGVFTLGSLACGLAPSIDALIAARLLQGLGGALMIPGSLAMITATFEPNRRGSAIGTWSAVTTLVTLAGPVMGGVFADIGFWRGVFLVNIPLAIAAIFILSTRVPESRDEEAAKGIDLPGAILAAVGLAALTYGFLSAPALGFGNPAVYGPLAGGVVALVLFVWVETRSPSPMLPLRLFRSRTFSGTNLLTLLLYGGLNVGMFFLSLDLIQLQGYSQSFAGLAFTPFAILLALMSRWAGGLVDRYGPRGPLIVGPALAGAGFFLLGAVGLTNGPADYVRTFLPGVIVLGIGMGITVAPLTSTVMGSAPRHFAGTASGVNNAIARAAGVLAIAIVGAVALMVFGAALAQRTSAMELPPDARSAIEQQAQRLGEARPPASLPPENQAEVADAIRAALARTFREALWLAAALAWLSALASAFLVEARPNPPD